MLRRFPALLLFTASLGFTASAGASDFPAEYAQVRKIALRDERVHDAFARANTRLDEKIVSLDPALAGYVRAHPSGRSALAFGEAPHEPFRATPAKPSGRMHPAAAGKTHTVAAGETLSSIAAQYQITVAKLQAANHIEDARKLRVGQTLALP